MQKPELKKAKYSFPEKALIFAVSLFASLAGGLIGLIIDCIILQLTDTGLIDVEQWNELKCTQALSLISFFGIMAYFHYDNFKINRQRKNIYKSEMKEYNNYLSELENESMENFVRDCRKTK